MAIVRSPRKHGAFTVLSNSILIDSRLSMRALGLLVRLLSRPDNWRTNSETLAREFSCGRDQMRTTLKELSDCGYVRLVKSNGDDGRIASEWHVFDDGIESDNTPGPEKPYAGEPAPGKPASGKPGPLTKTDLTKTDNKDAAPVGFAEFWSTWPASNRKGGKAECLKVWTSRHLEKSADVIVNHVKCMTTTNDWAKNFGEFIPAPVVYLRGARWDGASDSSDPIKNQFAGVI